MVMERLKRLFTAFQIPVAVLVGIMLYLVLNALNLPTAALVVVLGAIIFGSYRLFWDTFESLYKKQFALDYIAILAILVSLITKEFLVGAVIALMLASGETLEDYGANQAKESLTN